MNPAGWQWLKRLSSLLAVARTEPAQREHRIVAIQRNIILPIRLLIVASVYYYLYFSPWQGEVVTEYGVVVDTTKGIFATYAILVVAVAAIFAVVRRFPPDVVKWIVFSVGLGDALLLGLLTVLTGGFDSVLYWVYPGVIVLNAVSIPLEVPQIILNLALTIFFLVSGLIESSLKIELTLPSVSLKRSDTNSIPASGVSDITNLPAFAARLTARQDPLAQLAWLRLSKTTRDALFVIQTNQTREAELRATLADELSRIGQPPRTVVLPPSAAESADVTPGLQILRITVLWLLTFSIYGVQVLIARERAALAEQAEFLGRTERLRAAGRVAAEFAHQVKNPLTIINNLAFSLQKNLPADNKQILLIREEISKVDQIITQIMGYAALSEGRVEKLNVKQELELALNSVFPPELPTELRVQRDFSGEFPPLLMQRRHFTDTLANLLLNAREACGPRGHVTLRARRLADDTVLVTVRDDGPGIPPEKITAIFEAYYTTKERGSGLGLAIVKHNVELYGGHVTVQSELGKGTEFAVTFPAKTLVDTAS